MSDEDPLISLDDPNEDPLELSEIPDAASATGLRKSQERARQQKDQSKEFWQAILDTPIGRLEVWKLLEDAHAFETRFACGPSGFPQPEATWFHAGEQDFGLRLYQKLLVVAPESVLQMHRENDNRFAIAKPRRTKI